ncbi:MAG: sigma-70 family RNA polymerase sigma factor [Spirochaetales bacterium]|nr:sigma-70 family RNA polymerase sigma factor [Spirochaetales bacterium]
MDNRNREIDKFIITHQHKLYGFIMNRVRNESEADDIFQSTMEIVVSKYSFLKDPLKINSWIISICKNEIYKYYKKNDITVPLDDLELHKLETEYEYNNYSDLIKIAISLLTDDQRDVIQLRYFASMSYKDIASACNISIKKVKSRIFEAKVKLKNILPDLYKGILKPQIYFKSQKEKIIMEINNLKTGSYLFCRLSLPDQVKICKMVMQKDDFDSQLIENIGKISKGKEFLKIFHSKLLLNELISILNFCDRFTESRLIEELEIVDNEIAESIKQNMFVFDDLVLLDEKVMEELLNRVDHLDLVYSLCNASSQVKKHIFSVYSSLEKDKIIIEIGECDAVPESIMAAQQKFLGILREMGKNGEIEVNRDDPDAEYGVKIYFKA